MDRTDMSFATDRRGLRVAGACSVRQADSAVSIVSRRPREGPSLVGVVFTSLPRPFARDGLPQVASLSRHLLPARLHGAARLLTGDQRPQLRRHPDRAF